MYKSIYLLTFLLTVLCSHCNLEHSFHSLTTVNITANLLLPSMNYEMQ